MYCRETHLTTSPHWPLLLRFSNHSIHISKCTGWRLTSPPRLTDLSYFTSQTIRSTRWGWAQECLMDGQTATLRKLSGNPNGVSGMLLCASGPCFTAQRQQQRHQMGEKALGSIKRILAWCIFVNIVFWGPRKIKYMCIYIKTWDANQSCIPHSVTRRLKWSNRWKCLGEGTVKDFANAIIVVITIIFIIII